MKTVLIGGMWYIVRDNPVKAIGFDVLDGPYMVEHWATSMGRLREIA